VPDVRPCDEDLAGDAVARPPEGARRPVAFLGGLGDSGMGSEMKRKVNTSYEGVVGEALGSVLDGLRVGSIRLETEADLRAHLFHACLDLLASSGYMPPLSVHAEPIIGWWKADLALGPGSEIVVELKYEPWRTERGRVFARGKQRGQNVGGDLRKLREYARLGKRAHFIMIEKKLGGQGHARVVDGARVYEPFYFPGRTEIPRKEWHEEDAFAWIHYIEH